MIVGIKAYQSEPTAAQGKREPTTMNKTKIRRSLPIIIGAIIAILLATAAARAIQSEQQEAQTLQRQEQTIKQIETQKVELNDTLEEAKKQIEIKQQETQQKDQKIQELEQQVQARAEQKRVAALAAAQQAEAARQQQSAASYVSRGQAVAGVATSGGSGSCASEISKYNWPQGIAHAVMLAESGGNPGNLNNNPSTGDYSVGCFQINIYGANAASRPSEAALKDAATNVAFAYRIWQGNGGSFIGQWGVCSYKVRCS